MIGGMKVEEKKMAFEEWLQSNSMERKMWKPSEEDVKFLMRIEF